MVMVQEPAIGRAPLVSVCIANYNGEHMLQECIDSVLAQDTDAEVEIIVHDDASTDGSLDFLDSKYPMLRVIRSETNVGFCIGNNRMVAEARGEYVLLLNNDAALAHDGIRHLLQATDAIGVPAILTLPQHDWETGALVDRGCLLDPFCNPIPNLDSHRDDIAYVIGACLWCPRELWHTLGGFPDWMESIAEDLYLCSIARLRGLPVRALRESGYRHRQGSTFGGNRADMGLRTSINRRRLSERNKTRVLMLLTPGHVMWPLLVSHLIALSIEGLVLSLLRRDSMLLREIYSPAVLTPFREWSTLRERRHEVQAVRTISVTEWFTKVRWQLRKVTMLMRYGVPRVDQ